MWNNSLPLYKQIANNIKKEIKKLNLTKGDAIPSETKLAEMYGVSRVTIREATKLLVEENVVYRVQGSGTYVSGEKIEHDIFKLQGFTEEMNRLKNNPSNKVLEFELITATEKLREILHLNKEDKVFFVKRLRFADSDPLIIEESYLPLSLFPDLSVEVMTKSKYEYITGKGYQIQTRYGELIPLIPEKDIMSHLKLEQSDPLLFLKAYSTFKNNVPFEYSEIYFHPHKYAFKFNSTYEKD